MGGRLEQAVGVGGLGERHTRMDDRPHRTGGDERPHVLAHRGDDGGLLGGRAGPQRGRSDRRTLAQQHPEVELRARPALQPDHHEPPVCRERIDVAREVFRAHVVEDDVHACAAGGCLDGLDEVVVPVVDEHVGAERTAYLELLRRPRRDGDMSAERVRQLDRHRADPRRPAVDQQPLPGGERGRHEDVGPHRAGHLGQRRGIDERHPRRDREQLGGWDRDARGIPAAGEQRAGLIADRPPGDVRADRRHPPAALQPEVCRCARRRGVVALALEQVRAVDAGGDDVEEDLVGREGGVGDLGEDERLGASGGGHGDRQHEIERSRGVGHHGWVGVRRVAGW